MKKLKIYLDTSVISYLDQQDSPEKMNDTVLFWQDVRKGIYDIYVSDLVLSEMDNCQEPKRSLLAAELTKIQYKKAIRTDEAKALSNLYVKQGGLPPRSVNDADHIAIATINNCNIIVSWNFKHIVNLRAIMSVEAVNIKEGYAALRILSPSMLIEKAGDDK
jgi:predicted nucleic acid-binding protein